MTKLDRLTRFIGMHGFPQAQATILKDAHRIYRSDGDLINALKQWEMYTREGGNVFWDPTTQEPYRAVQKLPPPPKNI